MGLLLNVTDLQNLLWLWAYTVINGPVPTEVMVQVLQAVDNTDYTVQVNGNTYTFNSGVGSSVTSILTGLVASVNTATDCTATAISGPYFLLASNADLVLYEVLLDPNATKSTLLANETLRGWPYPWRLPVDNIGFDYQADPKMDKDFVLLKLGGPKKVGGSDVRFQETDNLPAPGNQNLYLEGIREYPVEVRVLSNTLEAIDWAAALQASFENAQYSALFDLAGQTATPPWTAVPVPPGDVQDITTPLETKYERVFFFDFDLRVNFQLTQNGTQYGPGTITEIQSAGQVGTLNANIDVIHP